MVLRIKEREEAIQLLAIDPQVCGKLLMLHRKGNGVEVEALRDRIPLRQDARKGPQMGSHGYRRLRRWKSVFLDASGGLGIYVNIQEAELGQGGSRVAHKVGAHPTPWARPPPLCLHRGSSDLHSKSPRCLLVQEKSSRKFYSVWTPFGIPFLRNSKTRKKQKLALGSRLIGQSQK